MERTDIFLVKRLQIQLYELFLTSAKTVTRSIDIGNIISYYVPVS